MEARIRAEFLDYGTVVEPLHAITVYDCIAVYRSRPGSIYFFDIQRLDPSGDAIGRYLWCPDLRYSFFG